MPSAAIVSGVTGAVRSAQLQIDAQSARDVPLERRTVRERGRIEASKRPSARIARALPARRVSYASCGSRPPMIVVSRSVPVASIVSRQDATRQPMGARPDRCSPLTSKSPLSWPSYCGFLELGDSHHLADAREVHAGHAAARAIGDAAGRGRERRDGAVAHRRAFDGRSIQHGSPRQRARRARDGILGSRQIGGKPGRADLGREPAQIDVSALPRRSRATGRPPAGSLMNPCAVAVPPYAAARPTSVIRPSSNVPRALTSRA